MNRMKVSFLERSTHCLVIVFLFITAFVRNGSGEILLIAAFMIWLIANISVALFKKRSALKENLLINWLIKRKEIIKKKEMEITEKGVKEPEQVTSATEPLREVMLTSLVLMMANNQITAQLSKSFPDVKWEWVSANPLSLIANGGIGRIKLSYATPYSYCELSFDKKGAITYSLIQISLLEDTVVKPEDKKAELEPEQEPLEIDEGICEPINITKWYKNIGSSSISELITDLNTRGYSYVLADENGNFTTPPSGTKDEIQTAKTIEGFPKKDYWYELISLLKDADLGVKFSSDREKLIIKWA